MERSVATKQSSASMLTILDCVFATLSKKQLAAESYGTANRHSRERGNPGETDWIPAFAGMTLGFMARGHFPEGRDDSQ